MEVLSNTIKQKRKEKAGKWEVPLPKVNCFSLVSCFGCTRSHPLALARGLAFIPVAEGQLYAVHQWPLMLRAAGLYACTVRTHMHGSVSRDTISCVPERFCAVWRRRVRLRTTPAQSIVSYGAEVPRWRACATSALRLHISSDVPAGCCRRDAKRWKRMVTKATFVGPGFTRKPPKYERFLRPTGLRSTKANVTHPELKCTFNLDIIGIKKNPNGPTYTALGVITRGTIIEVNFNFLLTGFSFSFFQRRSEVCGVRMLPTNQVHHRSPCFRNFLTFWHPCHAGKYAQVTNDPENDGCINAVLLV
ncbi:hypothetical protein B296_00056123 [Ensete ventricosum]|uniref:Uncharacterized protein n=1 Tax=Ensete ventricosum TaxID=4639 RepID=A0A426XWL8_ENSVE|nr:hypothetical protein B296_00056123 [Ensete ventricosum]